jgi:ribonuclease D
MKRSGIIPQKNKRDFFEQLRILLVTAGFFISGLPTPGCLSFFCTGNNRQYFCVHIMNMFEQSQSLPISYITTAVDLADCISILADAKTFAVDLEFDRDHYTYGFDLCLMQIATSERCYLVDPKSTLDITPIFPLLESEDFCKIMHCSGEDLRLLHSLQCYPKNLVDTELYAKWLNYERPSLGALLQHLFGLELDKKMQKINWTVRPMKEEQLVYAANDVRYLMALKKELEQQAEEKGLMQFIREENELLSTTIHGNGIKENFLKKNDLQFLGASDQYVLNEMFRYRDRLARTYNKPAHYIMSESLVRSLVFSDLHSPPVELEGVHYTLKTPSGKKELFKMLEHARHSALEMNLGNKRTRNDNGRLNGGGDRQWQDNERALVFTPIQKAIATKFGEHAVRFILSSTLITSFLQQQAKMGDIKTASRRQLIRDTAKELQIDLTSYE